MTTLAYMWGESSLVSTDFCCSFLSLDCKRLDDDDDICQVKSIILLSSVSTLLRGGKNRNNALLKMSNGFWQQDTTKKSKAKASYAWIQSLNFKQNIGNRPFLKHKSKAEYHYVLEAMDTVPPFQIN